MVTRTQDYYLPTKDENIKTLAAFWNSFQRQPDISGATLRRQYPLSDVLCATVTRTSPPPFPGQET